MSTALQVVSSIDCISRPIEANSPLTSHSNKATTVSCPSVLLVGRNGSWGTPVLRCFAKFESEFSFATPESAAPESVRNGGFHLILLDSTVPPEQRKELVSELIGSEATIFYAFPVENGCWWLPALRRGQNCHGAPAFRRSELPMELERILQDQIQAR